MKTNEQLDDNCFDCMLHERYLVQSHSGLWMVKNACVNDVTLYGASCTNVRKEKGTFSY
ncbi:TPA: hypothetical protein ACX6PR_000980 [Photobacterium damselae]